MNSPWADRQFSPQLPAGTFLAGLLGCCRSIACNATSSRHLDSEQNLLILPSIAPAKIRSARSLPRIHELLLCVWKPSQTIPNHHSKANAVMTTPAPDSRRNRDRGTTQKQPTKTPHPVSTNTECSSGNGLSHLCHLQDIEVYRCGFLRCQSFVLPPLSTASLGCLETDAFMAVVAYCDERP